MRIAVTGGTGFLGSYLIEDLLAHGHDLAVVLRPDSKPWRLAGVLDRVQVIVGSLDSVEGLRAPLKSFGPQGVAHLAWDGVGNVDRNSPSQARNIVQAVDLAALCIELAVGVFVGAGSQAEYGPYDRAIREDDIAQPTTLYGQAKLAAGTMVRQLAAERDMRCAWLRIFSTYGPKDAETWLIPSMIKTLRQGQRMSVTACEQRWGFLHARDAAAGFRIALENPAAQGVYNLGSPDAPPLRDTVTALRDLVNPKAELGFGDIAYRPDQVMVLKADMARLQALGWSPAMDLQSGLQETVAWHAQQT